MDRLTNILVWRAEIAVEDSDLELARSLVNQVRNRAKNSTPVMGHCSSHENLGKTMGLEFQEEMVGWNG